jgi:hypothetical protein
MRLPAFIWPSEHTRVPIFSTKFRLDRSFHWHATFYYYRSISLNKMEQKTIVDKLTLGDMGNHRVGITSYSLTYILI